MAEWWESMNELQHLFYYFAIPSTILLLIQTIMSIISLGGGADSDFDAADTDIDISPDTDGDFDLDSIDGSGKFIADFKFFSLRGIIAFFTVMGWVGVILSGMNLNPILIFVLSILAGIAADVGIGVLFYSLNKLQSKGNIVLVNALGKVGEVYIPIPSSGNGRGKIQVTVQERLIEAEAITDEVEKISTGTLVKVIGITDGHILKVKKNQ